MPWKFWLFDGSDDNDEPQDSGIRSDDPTDQNARSWWEEPEPSTSDNENRPSIWSQMFGTDAEDDN